MDKSFPVENVIFQGKKYISMKSKVFPCFLFRNDEICSTVVPFFYPLFLIREITYFLIPFFKEFLIQSNNFLFFCVYEISTFGKKGISNIRVNGT
jgi:hypothetical protein